MWERGLEEKAGKRTEAKSKPFSTVPEVCFGARSRVGYKSLPAPPSPGVEDRI